MMTTKEYKVTFDVVALDMESGHTHVVATYRNRDDAVTFIEICRNKRKRGDAIMQGIKRRIKAS